MIVTLSGPWLYMTFMAIPHAFSSLGFRLRACFPSGVGRGICGLAPGGFLSLHQYNSVFSAACVCSEDLSLRQTLSI